MQPRLFFVGSLNVDQAFRVERLPRAGETLLAFGFRQSFGGKGANQAVMAARLGATVSLLGRVGQDDLGERYRAHLLKEGIDISAVAADFSTPTGLASIWVAPDGANAIVVSSGANAKVSPADVTLHADKLRAADLVVAQLETPLDATLEAFRLARTAGVRTLLNPAPAAPLPAELLKLTTLLVPNEGELAELARRGIDGDAELAAAAAELRAQGPKAVIVTLEERGAYLRSAAFSGLMPAPAARAIDTVGAGDAFCGALAVALAEGQPLEQAVRFANRLAACTVARPGAQESYPSREEASRLRAEG